jgi:dTDP-4-dehydrorhamnose reductase
VDLLIIGADTELGTALQATLSHRGRHRSTSLTLSASRFKSERQAKKAARRGTHDALVDLRLAARLGAGEEPGDIDVERSHWLAKACHRSDIAYFLLSSDRVFSGATTRALREAEPGDATDPTGTALREAESRVREACPAAGLLRTGPLFAGASEPLLGGMLDTLLRSRRLELDNSTVFCPSSVDDVARVVAAILDQVSVGADGSGVFHYASTDRTTHYGFAEAILASAGQYADLGDVQLLPRDQGDDGDARARLLDCARLRDTFAIKQLPWRAQVGDAIKRYFLRRQQQGNELDGEQGREQARERDREQPGDQGAPQRQVARRSGLEASGDTIEHTS